MKILSSSTDPNKVSIISSDVEIKGDINSNSNIRIDGKVIGNVTAEGNFILGESGDIKGHIKAKNMTIGGKVEGTVLCKEKLLLESKSELWGDISAQVLVIQEGAKFEGKSKMTTISQISSNE
jgi:cytoskeletal protein CcmA (bactofilin family)